ncbi:hypothetical protein BDF21DRAFT_413502 [Thamnidium elegans]|nr:hypothetical protein BDF21DRAFT_413502 [Thamnidium elegans]
MDNGGTLLCYTFISSSCYLRQALIWVEKINFFFVGGHVLSCNDTIISFFFITILNICKNCLQRAKHIILEFQEIHYESRYITDFQTRSRTKKFLLQCKSEPYGLILLKQSRVF